MARGRRNSPFVLAERRYVITPQGCWEAIGCRLDSGYVQVSVSGRRDHAHRLAWREANGPIPDGMLVCHHCDNPPCVQPDHLFLGTPADNMSDKTAKGRGKGMFRPGVDHPGAKLNPERVREIRRRLASGETQRSIAASFGVALTTISAIALGRNWSWVR
jgi:hypothetical protein